MDVINRPPSLIKATSSSKGLNWERVSLQETNPPYMTRGAGQSYKGVGTALRPCRRIAQALLVEEDFSVGKRSLAGNLIAVWLLSPYSDAQPVAGLKLHSNMWCHECALQQLHMQGSASTNT